MTMELSHTVPEHENQCGPNMQGRVLPHDLKFVKTSELLPMAYNDFTKCLQEDFCKLPCADGDGVVPSVSPILPRGSCFSSSSADDSSDEMSTEYSSELEDCSEVKKNEQSPLLNRCSPFGTLNWGLTPTIIYKTPGRQNNVEVVGNGCMKCSITEGNVELITPPPRLKHNKRRISGKRKITCRRRRRKINFGEGLPDEKGLQEVPSDKQDSNNDSDSSLEDPMWFDEDHDWVTIAKDQSDEVKEYLRELEKILPTKNTIKKKSKRQILYMAVQHIQVLRQRIEYLSSYVQEVESCKHTNFVGTDDVFEMLPQFSWSDIDEPCYEIQAILNSLSPAGTEPDHKTTDCHVSTTTSEEPKKKRKYTKRKKTTKHPEKSKTKGRKRNSKLTLENSQKCNTPIKKHISQSPVLGGFSFKRIGTPLPKILPKPSSPFLSPGFRHLSPAPLMLSPVTTGPLPISSTYTHSSLVPQCVPMVATRVSVSRPIDATGVVTLTKSSTTAQTTLVTSIGDQTQLLQTGQVVSLWDISNNEWHQHDKGEKSQKKKTVPNGYMLYCKEKRACIKSENPDLSSGRITKLLSQNWNQFSEEEKRPYKKEATTLRHDENEWIMETPF